MFTSGAQVEPMLKGMCNNVTEHLIDKGFYSLMHVSSNQARQRLIFSRHISPLDEGCVHAHLLRRGDSEGRRRGEGREIKREE